MDTGIICNRCFPKSTEGTSSTCGSTGRRSLAGGSLGYCRFMVKGSVGSPATLLLPGCHKVSNPFPQALLLCVPHSRKQPGQWTEPSETVSQTEPAFLRSVPPQVSNHSDEMLTKAGAASNPRSCRLLSGFSSASHTCAFRAHSCMV